MFVDLDEMVTCPQCDAEQALEEALLGALGDTVHFRCRRCAWGWSDDVEHQVAFDEGADITDGATDEEK